MASRSNKKTLSVVHKDATKSATRFGSALDLISGDSQMELPAPTLLRSDIMLCLKDVITDQLPVRRSDIQGSTKPGDLAEMDIQGWGICLANFAAGLGRRRDIYEFYDHRERYTQDTFQIEFKDIYSYLEERIRGQFTGIE
jgi:hypothetical protein